MNARPATTPSEAIVEFVQAEAAWEAFLDFDSIDPGVTPNRFVSSPDRDAAKARWVAAHDRLLAIAHEMQSAGTGCEPRPQTGGSPSLFAALTPTEDLVLEVLAGRYRLGEQLWTFKSIHRKAIDALVDKNLVWKMHGVVERTIRVGLTDEGKDACLSPNYVLPSDREDES